MAHPAIAAASTAAAFVAIACNTTVAIVLHKKVDYDGIFYLQDILLTGVKLDLTGA